MQNLPLIKEFIKDSTLLSLELARFKTGVINEDLAVARVFKAWIEPYGHEREKLDKFIKKHQANTPIH